MMLKAASCWPLLIRFARDREINMCKNPLCKCEDCVCDPCECNDLNPCPCCEAGTYCGDAPEDI